MRPETAATSELGARGPASVSCILGVNLLHAGFTARPPSDMGLISTWSSRDSCPVSLSLAQMSLKRLLLLHPAEETSRTTY